jgi:hypothetical protein
MESYRGGAGAGRGVSRRIRRHPLRGASHPCHRRITAKAEEGKPVGGGDAHTVAWLDRPVRPVFLNGANTEYAEGDLEEVNGRGIVLSVETHVGHPAQPLFYPWRAVRQLLEAREP